MFLPSPNGPPLKIGFYRASSIGDVVLATACIDLLMKLQNRLQTKVEISWIGRNPSLELLSEAFPWINFINIADFSDLSKSSELIKKLASIHFMVDLQGNLRSRMLTHNLTRASGQPIYRYDKAQVYRAKLVAEARMFGRNRVLPANTKHAKKLQFHSMVEALKQGLKKQLPSDMLDGIETLDPRPTLPTSHDSNHRPWQKELQFGHWLAVAPGASYNAKRSPIGVFSEIIAMTRFELERKLNTTSSHIGILILGDDHDRDKGLKLLDNLAWKGPSLNLAGKLSLWESALALKSSDFLLSNDSGLAHIAEAVKTPVAVLFGPTVEAFGFAPHLDISRAYSTSLGCRPCSKHGKVECRYHDKLCFANISKPDISDHIATHMVRLIEEEKKNKTLNDMPPIQGEVGPHFHV
ncbi:MAG: glycosyltransferase family 9 protein [Bdellovibrionota bacterium]